MIRKFRNTLGNQRGMAIIMVTSAIAILSVLLVEFTFDTKLNKIRIENQIDRVQAKLNAQAGLNFALAKLKIYKQAWNTLEDNESMKKTVPPSLAEKVVTQPFVYPIPLGKTANVIQKNAIADFEKNNLLKGELSVIISPVTGFLNPNTLKIIKDQSKKVDDEDQSQTERDEKESTENLKPYQFMEKTFIETLDQLVKEKIEADEDFALKYSNLNVELLIKELKYYINNAKDYDEAEKSEIEKNYELAGVQAKHGPMDSIDEMYQLQGWDDDIINLVKDKMSVHQVSVININEITENQLKVLFPTFSKFQLESFFKRRNGDADQGIKAEEFKTVDEFKKYITDELAVTDSTNYDKRISEYSKAGISLGVAGKLFKVISKGVYNRSSYTIEAFIDLPVKPAAPKKQDPNNKNKDKDKEVDPENQENPDDQTGNEEDDKGKDKEKEATKTYLLEPRVVEIKNI